MKTLRSNWILVLIILIGLFLRSYKPLTLFQYSHDQDLAGWVIRDVLVNHHLRLIGQETSSHGIFIGPYFYYLQIPFYLLTGLDPAGALLLPIILGGFAVFSTYFILLKIFNKTTAFIGGTLYSVSTLIVFTEREVVPTMPVMLWTIWYFYSLWLILNGKKYGYVIIGILLGLIWSINLQLVILLPLVLVAQVLSKKKINFKEFFVGIFTSLFLNLPFIFFELRHGFQQTKALISSLTTNKDYIAGTATGFLPKLDRTMQLVYKNSTNLFTGNNLNIDVKIIFWLFIFLFAFLIWKKILKLQLGLILFLWQIIYILFFTKISLNISEYYLNGMNIVFILAISLGVASLMQSKLKPIGYLIVGFLVILNLYSFFTRSVNADGYIQRKDVISYIKEDAKIHNYPCVSLSFITSPGNNLGYRYFTWEEKLKTKPVSINVPTYSIVFPLSGVNSFDKSFGALGVVKPDYKRYNLKTVQASCQGDDFTTSEPMFGFTN